RVNNAGGTGSAAAVEVACNVLGPLITVSPDPNMTRSDLRTHSDVIQLESCDGINIHGNSLIAMNTTDGTSDPIWFRTVAPFQAVPPNSPDARPHPQAMSGIMINPGIGPITNLRVHAN